MRKIHISVKKSSDSLFEPTKLNLEVTCLRCGELMDLFSVPPRISRTYCQDIFSAEVDECECATEWGTK